MKPIYSFSESERVSLESLLSDIPFNPYHQYPLFKESIASLKNNSTIPDSFMNAVDQVLNDRVEFGKHVHVFANCPIDPELPQLDLTDPIESKYKVKKTFIAEAFMELIAQLQKTPLFSYASRANGDYFTDLVSFKQLQGKKTGFTDGDLIYHSDRSYHSVRADYVSLLGLYVSNSELIYTNYIDAKDIKRYLSQAEISMLSEARFVTAVDDRSKQANRDWLSSEPHAIFLMQDQIRYQDTFTQPMDPDDIEALRALLALKHAISQAEKQRHMVKKRELLIFGNQTGIHNREWIDVNDAAQGRKRWLLKTYSFSSSVKVRQFAEQASVNDPYCISDK